MLFFDFFPESLNYFCIFFNLLVQALLVLHVGVVSLFIGSHKMIVFFVFCDIGSYFILEFFCFFEDVG